MPLEEWYFFDHIFSMCIINPHFQCMAYLMIYEIDFIPVREARELTPSRTTALISIHDDGVEVAQGVPTVGWGFFDHIGVDDAAYDEEQIKDYGEEFKDFFGGTCTKVHALKILVMIKRIRETQGIEKIIFQCDSGRSRSAAVAKYYSEKYGTELERNPEYANSLIYTLLNDPSHFDKALDKYVNKKASQNTTDTEKRDWFPLGWIDILLEKIFGK